MRLLPIVPVVVAGFLVYWLLELRADGQRSVELAEAECSSFVRSIPNLGLDPAQVDCSLIVDDDFLLTFRATAKDEYYVDCLAETVFFSGAVRLRECGIYRR